MFFEIPPSPLEPYLSWMTIFSMSNFYFIYKFFQFIEKIDYNDSKYEIEIAYKFPIKKSKKKENFIIISLFVIATGLIIVLMPQISIE